MKIKPTDLRDASIDIEVLLTVLADVKKLPTPQQATTTRYIVNHNANGNEDYVIPLYFKKQNGIWYLNAIGK